MSWKSELKENWYKIILSGIALLVATIISFLASYYTSNIANVTNVSDIILDHFGPFNLNFLYSWGFLIIIIIFFAYPLFFKIKDFLYMSIQLSFLAIVRSLFIILTHIQTPSTAVEATLPGIFEIFKFTNDQFFSGHVAVFFLGFLLFRENKKISYFFLISSIVMVITVLGMHQHYSIDVFSAFFITYGCYKMVEWVYRKYQI